jgi:hypothetical protein
VKDQQKWTVLDWGVIDGGLLGALIECVACENSILLRPGCEMCDGDGVLHQPYRLPNGAAIDLDRHAELLIQIEAPDATPEDET